ncbi:MAG: hypothetical protein C0594_12160, partial [Marinilabiliales bacterium]
MTEKKFNRRDFIKKSAIIGSGAVLASCAGPLSLFGKEPDMAVIEGDNYYNIALKSIETLGGIEKFVPQNSKVGILINSAFDEKGAYVSPDVSLAVLWAIHQTNPKEVKCLQLVADDYWKRGNYYDDHIEIVSSLKHVESNVFPAEFNDDEWKLIDLPKSVSLKNAEIVKAVEECDVLINVAIAKHHASALYTGALKNMM